jgi:membrane protein
LNATFKAKPTDEPIFSLIRSRAASLGLVAALGFMLIVSLAASAGLSALEQWSAGKVVLSALNTAVSLGIFTLLFAAIYRVLRIQRSTGVTCCWALLSQPCCSRSESR